MTGHTQSFRSESPWVWLTGCHMFLVVSVALLYFAAEPDAFLVLAFLLLGLLLPISILGFFWCGNVTLSPEGVRFSPYFGEAKTMRWEEILRVRVGGGMCLFESKQETIKIRFNVFSLKQAHCLRRALLIWLSEDFDVEDLLRSVPEQTSSLSLGRFCRRVNITPIVVPRSLMRVAFWTVVLGIIVFSLLWLLIRYRQWTGIDPLVLRILIIFIFYLPLMLGLLSPHIRQEISEAYRSRGWRKRKIKRNNQFNV